MQNLCLFNTRTVPLTDLTGDNVIRRFAVDTDRQRVYLLTGDQLYSLDQENQQLKSIYQTKDSGTTLEDLCFFSELNHLCFALSNGDLFSLQFDDDDTETNLNVIGTLEECINQLILSPDQQTLIAVTKSKVLLLSTANDYEPIAEAVLDTNEFGEQQFVNVGWGSKTTQFHGSAGKKAALEPTNMTPIKPLSDDDDQRSRVVWRDDGDLFAVSFVSHVNQLRLIKIFNKQGQLQATSESSLNGCIESSIGWKTSGELISAAMRFNNGQKLTISFLEKNGLKHGEFLLEPTAHVDHLAWNKDSSILAVVLRQQKNSYLQLWSTSNYHWYEKQSFPFESVRIQAIVWDIDVTNKLHFVTDRGEYRSMTWSWTTQVSYTNLRSLVCLIDGYRLNVTDFTHSSVPPPMCSYEIQCPSMIVAITSDEFHDQFILILNDRSIAICSTSCENSKYPTIVHLPGLKFVYRITAVIDALESPIKDIRHATHYRVLNGELHFIEDSQLFVYNLDKKCTTHCLPMNFSCLTTAINCGSMANLYFQDVHGKLYRLDKNEFHARMHFPRPCAHFSVLTNEQFLGLTENYRLYLNNNELAHNCNSYFIHDQTIVVYSTLQHQLAFRSLINGETVTETSHRRTERGTRIICTAYTDLKLVLQMPRGNLETIYPRPLLLTYICSELIDRETKNYQRAFELMRKNRLNLNFLYDYKPKEFFDEIPKFIDQARNDDDLCLFLSEIEHEKNIRDQYMKFILKCDRQTVSDEHKWFPKANLICEKFRQVLLSTVNPTDHINSILTSFVKQNPSNMEGALKYLSENRAHFDQAIRYLTYFIDIDRLYDVALGTYDFDLVLMISEKTQKDPKEYLPELNQLRAIKNIHWQRFQIDCRLKRFRKAIENGSNYFIEQLVNQTADENDQYFPVYVNILETNRLYKMAVKHFLSNDRIRPEMMFVRHIFKLYADYLLTKKYYVEAGLIYERGRYLEQAANAYRQGKDVQNTLKLLPTLTRTFGTGQTEMYRSLAEQCRHDGLHVDSGEIYEYYLNDQEEALISYLQGHHWSHAIRLLSTTLTSRSDLYEHEFLSTLNEFHDDLVRQIDGDNTKFQNSIKRLNIIRTNLFEQIKEILDSGRDYDFDENDEVSDQEDRQTLAPRPVADDSGSIRTRLTKKSTSVSSSKKSQRRAAQQQEKLVQLKEGSKHEDLALVRELSILITKFDKLNGEIRHLCKIFYQISTQTNNFTYEDKGEQLQKKYNDCMTLIEKQLANIWLTQSEREENVQSMIISKKIREKFRKELDLISHSYRVSPSLTWKTSQWKLILFDSETNFS